eukprot:scaffold30523_cov90-Isochrysis_galbana.AAC.1
MLLSERGPGDIFENSELVLGRCGILIGSVASEIGSRREMYLRTATGVGQVPHINRECGL